MMQDEGERVTKLDKINVFIEKKVFDDTVFTKHGIKNVRKFIANDGFLNFILVVWKDSDKITEGETIAITSGKFQRHPYTSELELHVYGFQRKKEVF